MLQRLLDCTKYRLAAGRGHRDEALKLYRQAAHHGHGEALLVLGMLYEDGSDVDGIHLNVTEAVRFYRLASDQGNEEALGLLCNMYEKGRCGTRGSGVCEVNEEASTVSMRQAAGVCSVTYSGGGDEMEGWPARCAVKISLQQSQLPLQRVFLRCKARDQGKVSVSCLPD